MRRHFYGVADVHRIRYTSIAITTAASGVAIYIFAISRKEVCSYSAVMNTCAVYTHTRRVRPPLASRLSPVPCPSPLASRPFLAPAHLSPLAPRPAPRAPRLSPVAVAPCRRCALLALSLAGLDLLSLAPPGLIEAMVKRAPTWEQMLARRQHAGYFSISGQVRAHAVCMPCPSVCLCLACAMRVPPFLCRACQFAA